MANITFPLSLGGIIQVRARGCYLGYVKDAKGNKTDKLLIDPVTGLPVWWISTVVFPVGSMGGEDVNLLIRLPHDGCPIDIPRGESVPVEFIEPSVVLDGNGRLNLHISGIKRIGKE